MTPQTQHDFRAAAERIAKRAAALGDPVRTLALLLLVAEGAMTNTTIRQRLIDLGVERSDAAISLALQGLHNRRLIRRQKHGREVYNTPSPMARRLLLVLDSEAREP